jgi:hypothetical protein
VLRQLYKRYNELKARLRQLESSGGGGTAPSVSEENLDEVMPFSPATPHTAAGAPLSTPDISQVKMDALLSPASPSVAQLRAEKTMLQKILFRYQSEFQQQHGYSPHTAVERAPFAKEYKRYKVRMG